MQEEELKAYQGPNIRQQKVQLYKQGWISNKITAILYFVGNWCMPMNEFDWDGYTPNIFEYEPLNIHGSIY